MSENAVEISEVKKSFKVYSDKGQSLKERMLSRGRNAYREHQVLRGVSVEIPHGQAVGLIGQNGCGKSTLLKILTRIIYPDSGSVKISGKVSSLLELGAGFHPDMTGRENIYINASIFGLKKHEIDARIERIIDFSELQEFIDAPVRTYSSGMYMRLAFSVAINVDADVLLIDEILAVGDAAFQDKCFRRLEEIKRAGTTIVIVSHALEQIEQICDRTIWLRNGSFFMDGAPSQVHPQYCKFMESIEENSDAPQRIMRWGSGEVNFTDVEMLNADGKRAGSFSSCDSVDIVMHFKSEKKLSNIVPAVGFYSLSGVYVYGTNMNVDNAGCVEANGDGKVTMHIPRLNLTQGEYTLQVALCASGGMPYDYWENQQHFNVTSDKAEEGLAVIKHTWIK